MLRNILTGLIAIIILLAISGCEPQAPSSPVIAISKASNNYINWLKTADSTIQYINLYSLSVDSAMAVLKTCSGLLITGGEDVYPGIYGDANDTARCGTINHYRDTLEINLIIQGLKMEMPIMGVCRGEQIMGVVFGGALFIDIPEDYDTSIIHRCEDYRNCFHMVYVEPNSLLQTICECDSALVTTNHHQAIKVLGPDLKANSFSDDGLIEGIELADPQGYPFLLAVQWHPERMDSTNPLSGPIARVFIEKCREYSIRW